MSDQRIDFSSLDPSRNSQRWEARIATIANRASENHRRKLTIAGQFVAWSRPVLAIAAGFAIVGWVSLAAVGKQTRSTPLDPSLAIATWASRNEVPSTELVITILGGSSDEE